MANLHIWWPISPYVYGWFSMSFGSAI